MNPTTLDLKQFLKRNLRSRVRHPDGGDKFVRVTHVTRLGWTYNDGDRSVTLAFDDMRPEQINRVRNNQPLA